MKKLGDMLKGKNIKAFFVNHGEKLGAVVVAAIVLIALTTTDWTRIDRSPAELADKVSDANADITASKWPEEKKAEVPLQDFLAQAETMVQDMNIAPFEYRVPMLEPLVKPAQLITDTKWGVVEELIADPGAVLMELAPEPANRLNNQILADASEPDPADAIPLDLRAREDLTLRGGTTRGGRGRFDDDYEEDDGFGGAPQGGTGRYSKGARAGDTGRGSRDPRTNQLGEREVAPLTRARGQRFVALRGLFDVRRQKLNLANALRLSLPSEADDKLEFRGFRIQRQRAVAGSQPWNEENWEELDIDEAVRVLADAAGFALPILDPRVTNHYITMPLPPRLIGYWTNEATHPRLEQFKLTDEEREQLEEMITLLRSQAEEQLQKDQDETGGFSSLQEDITKLRQRATEEQMDKIQKEMDKSAKTVAERVKDIFGLGVQAAGNTPYGSVANRGRNRRGGTGFSFGGNDDDDDGRGGRGFGNQFGGRRIPQPTTPDAQRRMLAKLDSPQNLHGIEAAIGRVLLFRYLDFTVKPGEAYRYRVKLLFNNPAYAAYEREQVDDEAVIQGETRESDWSEPSEVVVIPPDTHAFVSNVTLDKDPGRNGANFEIFQWHQELGTVIHDKMMCYFGQFLGGTKPTLVLNLAKPSFEAEQATFTSSMALVDASGEPMVNLADHPDLRSALEGVRGIRTDRETSLGVPAEALVVTDDGRTIRLDSMSQERERVDLDTRLKIVRDQYNDLKDNGGGRLSDRDRLMQSGRLGEDDRGGRGRRGGERGSSALRKGRKGR